jgi:hypothetical protein
VCRGSSVGLGASSHGAIGLAHDVTSNKYKRFLPRTERQLRLTCPTDALRLAGPVPEGIEQTENCGTGERSAPALLARLRDGVTIATQARSTTTTRNEAQRCDELAMGKKERYDIATEKVIHTAQEMLRRRSMRELRKQPRELPPCSTRTRLLGPHNGGTRGFAKIRHKHVFIC